MTSEMKPILFNTAMVRALLDGCKTVTRRVVKPQPELLIKIENGGVYYADCSGGWYCVEGNSQLTEQRLYGRDGRPYLFSDEICGIWPEGIYRVVSFEGAPGENGLSFHLNLPPEQEKDDECPQSYLRGVPRGAARLRSSKAYGRESIKQCSRESGMGNGARKLERQEAASHGDCRGETPNVKINRCTEGGDCRLIQTGDESKENCRDLFCEPMCYLENIKIPFSVGQILYVRETWAAWSRTIGTIPRILYKADRYTDAEKIKWRPSIHMPLEAARIFLRLTNVKVQRVQDITDEDARKEGCKNREDFHRVWNDCFANPRPVKIKGVITHYESYPWEDIHETRTFCGKPWHVIGNPWVFAYEFERCERPKEDV